jgi:hypothetical protein
MALVDAGPAIRTFLVHPGGRRPGLFTLAADGTLAASSNELDRRGPDRHHLVGHLHAEERLMDLLNALVALPELHPRSPGWPMAASWRLGRWG